MDQFKPDQPRPQSKSPIKPPPTPPTRPEPRPEARADLIPNPAVRRLSLYLRQLEGFKRKDRRTISSRQLGPFVIQPIGDLAATVQKQQIRLAMVAVPADNAQEVVDQLVSAGVRGILNFAPTSVNVPPHVALNAVDLSVQLEQLSFQVNFAGMAPTLSETGS